MNEDQEIESPREGCLKSIIISVVFIGGGSLLISAGEIGKNIFLALVLGIPALLLISYIFENGTSGAGEQTIKVVFAVIIFLAIGFLVTQCSSGDGNCAYRAGCW